MLNIKSINKSFNIGKRNEISVLKDISLSFPDTGLYIIVGPSGSGKSTLLSLLGALDQPDSGSITYNGQDISSLSNKERDYYRQNIVSFIFQENNLIDYLSLKDNASLKSEHDSSIVDETLAKLKIDHLKDKIPASLSGGEKERGAIARAILADSKIVLCDEPTASLDAKNAENVISYLKDISDNKLVIVVSHDEKLCKKYSDNIIHISDGVIEQNTSIEEVEVTPLKLEKRKTYRSNIFKRTLLHIKHNMKQSLLLVFLSTIAFLCVSMIVGLTDGVQRLVDKSVTDLIHSSPLTISSYYENFASIALISDNEVKYETGININEQNSIITSLHKNIITDEFINYITKDPEKNTFFSFNNDQSYSLIYESNGVYNLFDEQNMESLTDYVNKFLGKQGTIGELVYDQDYFKHKYNWLAGKFPENENQAILVFNKNKSINDNISKLLSLKGGDDPLLALGKKFYFADHNGLYQLNQNKDVTGHYLKDQETLIKEGRDVRSVNNYLIKYANDYFNGDVEGQEYAKEKLRGLFKDEVETRNLKSYTKIQNSSTLKDMVEDGTYVDEIEIVGLAEIPEKTNFTDKMNGILVPSKQLKKVRERNSQSLIAKEIDQHIVLADDPNAMIPNLYGYINTITDYSSSSLEEYVINFLEFFENRKFFSTNNEVSSIEIYADDVKAKENYIKKINEYNKDKDDNSQIKHLDLTKKVTSYFNTYFGILKSVLYSISIITLVVSMILSLSIIFNIVISRTKEIGIYRASGYTQKYIFFMLEAESMFLGFLSGVLGVGIAHIVIPILNFWLKTHKTELDLSHLVVLGPLWTVLIIVIAILATVIATLLPSIIYSKKKPIDIIK